MFAAGDCVRPAVGYDRVCKLTGYREIVRVREDGKVEVEVDGKRTLVSSPRS